MLNKVTPIKGLSLIGKYKLPKDKHQKLKTKYIEQLKADTSACDLAIQEPRRCHIIDSDGPTWAE